MTDGTTPEWNDGSVAAVATARLPQGPTVSWIALPPVGDVRALVPRAQAAASTEALRQLVGHASALRRLSTEIGVRAIKLGGARLLRPRPLWDDAASRLLGQARRVSGFGDAVGVIRVNPNRPNCKPVMQLLAPDSQRTVAYVKVGWDDLTAPLVRGEIATMRALDPPDGLRIPEVLGADTGDVPTLALSPLVTDASDRRAGTPIDLARAALRVFGPDGFGTEGAVPLAECGVLLGARSQLEQLDLPYAAAVLERLDMVCARHGTMEVTTGRWHGDWNRANVVLREDGVAAWDWERSTTGAPHGLDAAYTLLHDNSPEESLVLLTALGLGTEHGRALILLALVTAATRHAKARSRGMQSRATRALRLLDDALAVD